MGLVYSYKVNVLQPHESAEGAGWEFFHRIALQLDQIRQAGYSHNDVALRNIVGSKLIDVGLFQKLGPRLNKLYPLYTTLSGVFLAGASPVRMARMVCFSCCC